MDHGRKADLDMLYKATKAAQTGFHKKRYEKLIHNIRSEDRETMRIREQLIRAVRASDEYSIKKFSEILNRKKHKSLNGRQY